jgi:diaminopimelate decarboxylase
MQGAAQIGSNRCIIHCHLRVRPPPAPTCLLLQAARAAFDTAEEMGFEMELLDIGGGFTGQFDACGNVIFGDIALTINSALAAHFPADSGVHIIAEPGRYFAGRRGCCAPVIYATARFTECSD